MDWVSLILGIADKTGSIILKKLALKHKDALKKVEDELWEEHNKEFELRDMALIDNLSREKEQLERIFYDEIHKAMTE